jgi:hypothetical protein
MYIVLVILVMFICPALWVVAASITSHHTVSVYFLIAKWYVFWAVGIRLFTAGVRQVPQPAFTAREIFGIQGAESYPAVREVGVGTLSMGTVAICSLFRPGWIIPAALVGSLFYGLAGLLHVLRKGKNVMEQTATISDAFGFLVLLVVVVRGWA